MKKGQILEGVVTRVDYPNKGRVETPEGVVTVKNTMPGQRVQLAVSKKRGERAEGRLLAVLAESELASERPRCGQFGSCGGCLYQTMDPRAQLNLKKEQVARLLDPVLKAAGYPQGTADASLFEGIEAGDLDFAYRNKMEFSFGDETKGGPLTLGLHKRGGRYDVISTPDCALVHADVTAVLRETLAFFTEHPLPYYHKLTHEGVLRHLLIRRSYAAGELLVCLVTAEHSWGSLLEEYKARLLALPLAGSICGILHMRNDSVADVVRAEETTVLYGRYYFYETVHQLKFKVTPFSFFQTNSVAANTLYGVVRRYVLDAIRSAETTSSVDTLFDLYCGTGTIAQIVAPVARRVIGVEIVEEAVAAARENAALNGLTNCEFLAGDVLKVIDSIRERPELIILDPPRDGIHPKALPKIIDYGAAYLLYVSCKPTSLARDLEVLLASGYEVKRICCVDMFPQTGNVETVVLLSR